MREQVESVGRELVALEDIDLSDLSALKLFLTGISAEDPGMAPYGRGVFDLEARMHGRDWPQHALTMIGVKRLDQLQAAVEDVLRSGIPGDFIETGVWRGGAVVFIKAILKVYGVTDRRVWVADSFSGFPSPCCPQDDGMSLHRYRELCVSEEEVRENFRRLGLLDDSVRFLRGYFDETLPAFNASLAVIRLDSDYYESTMQGLINLYDKVSPGGYTIVDDYGVAEPCRLAVDEFRRARGIREPFFWADNECIWWRKP